MREDPQNDLDRPSDTFARRHLGPRSHQIPEMLKSIGLDRLEDLARATVPDSIRTKEPLVLDGLPSQPLGEHELLRTLREIASENRVYRSYLGMGYHDVIVPGVIQRNVLENPGWYTQYTPYQAEISQGRLEALRELPDHGRGPVGAAAGERVPARRSDGRGGGTRPVSRGRSRSQDRLLRVPGLPPADPRRAAHAGRSARHDAARRRSRRGRLRRARLLRCAAPVPGQRRTRLRSPSDHREGARGRRPGRRVGRPARHDPAHTAR